MHSQFSLGLFAIACYVSTSLAEHIPPNHILWGPSGPPAATLLPSTKTQLKPRSVDERDTDCTNAPDSRACWYDQYSVATDFDKNWPTTNKIVKYNLDITQTTCNPDGNQTIECMLVNNQYPGPTIIADWGDTLSVTVKNSMQDNGTGIHWHGMRQLGSVGMDGVPGITECPLAPGQSKTYNFKLTQYGTTWYHSHYSAQYGMGVLGGLIINGPATENYDVDLGTFMVNDWYLKTAYQVDLIALTAPRGPPPGDNILVNGTNTNKFGGGKHSTVSLTKGNRYLLRLINPSVDNQIYVKIDNHPFTIVTSDLVPIYPITTDWLLLGIGQRYNVIIEANQTVDNYWFRAVAASGCTSLNANTNGTSAIFRYSGAPNINPNSTTTTPAPTDCNEPSPLVPWVPNTVNASTFNTQAATLPVNVSRITSNVTTNNQSIVVWGINLTAIDVNWEKPILSYVQEGDFDFPTSENLIELPVPNIWTYWIIQQAQAGPGGVTAAPNIPHPIHLHGHDFYVLGQGAGTFTNSSIPSLTFNNPTRRDVAFLPAGGWLVIAFPTDNPGAWLMHCHIAWHISEGLGVQFLESKSQLPPYPADYNQTCAAWNSYYDGDPVYLKDDSGL